MSAPRRRGRRIPPKARGARPVDRAADAFSSAADSSGNPAAGIPSAGSSSGMGRPTRAQNRAAKRATGVRAKPVGRGRVGSRSRGPSNVGLIALVVGAVAIGAAVIAFGNPFGGPAASPSASAGASASAAAAASHGDGTCPTSQPPSLAAGDTRDVTIETSKGTIVFKLDGARAPIATGNFAALVACHYYDGIVFHRLVPGFVIQGGDPLGTGGGGPGYMIKDDPLNGTYRRGTVAMARTAQPDSQGSQFFIVLSDDANSALTSPQVLYPYAILGEVTSGMDVVDAIAAMPNGGAETGNQALDPVAMTRVTISAQRPTGAPTAGPTVPAASQ
jgi:peptidyl-prolyl cis-trans isomerase B (cyclophilin B)